jgi:hypothetical protein
MNRRERTIRSTHFEKHDRLPVLYRIKPDLIRLHPKEIHVPRERYPDDILQYEKTYTLQTFQSAGKLNMDPGKLIKDEWYCVWQTLTNDYLSQLSTRPLKDLMIRTATASPIRVSASKASVTWRRCAKRTVTNTI